MPEPDSFDVVIEIPRGSRNKYEFDEATESIRLDRVLYSSVHYPTDYGFVPDTRAEDGDHLDVLVIVEEPTFPGCRMAVRPVGCLKMRDERGLDDKMIAVPLADPRFDEVRDLEDLAHHWLREIENFFQTYKTLEAKDAEVLGWEKREFALAVVRKAREAYSTESASSRPD